MTINERISSLIKENKNFTQKKLAEYAGIPQSTISNWLKLGRSIPAEFIIPICEFFGVDCLYLLSGQNSDETSIRLSPDDREYLELFHRLSLKKRYELLGYMKRMLEEESVAAEAPLKEAAGK